MVESELTIVELIEASNVRVAQALADWYMVLIMTRDNSVAEIEIHNLKVAGSNPAPANEGDC